MSRDISELSVDELEQILEIRKNIQIHQDRLNELIEDKPTIKRGPKPGRRKMSARVKNKIRKARLKQIAIWRKENRDIWGRPNKVSKRNSQSIFSNKY